MKKLIIAGLAVSMLVGGTAAYAAGKELKALVVDFKIKLQGKNVAAKSKIVTINGEYYISVKDAATLLGNGNKVTVDKKNKTIQFNASQPSATPSTGNQNGNSNGDDLANYKINIPDSELKKIILRKIYSPSGVIYYNDIKNITEIDEQIRGVKSLEGLQHFKQLKKLRLSGGELSDLGPLAQLSQLEELVLMDNKIVDLKVLGGLKKLTTLNLSQNAIVELSPLQSLTGLQTLHLTNNQITDIRPLKNLTALKVLTLASNDLTDIVALKGMNLQTERFGLQAASGNLFWPLYRYRTAFEINGKTYLMKWAKKAGGEFSFYTDADNRIYAQGKSSLGVSDFLNLSESRYEVISADNPFVDGEIEIMGSDYVDYVKEESVYTSATTSYPVFQFYDKNQTLIHTVKLEKGNHQGAIDLKDSIGSFLVPFEDILAKAGVTFDVEFDRTNKLIIFKL